MLIPGNHHVVGITFATDEFFPMRLRIGGVLFRFHEKQRLTQSHGSDVSVHAWIRGPIQIHPRPDAPVFLQREGGDRPAYRVAHKKIKGTGYRQLRPLPLLSKRPFVPS